jgi:hypothetical protein
MGNDVTYAVRIRGPPKKWFWDSKAQINLFMRSYPKIIFPNPKPYSVTNADGSVTPLIQLIQISNGLFEFILDTLYHTLMDAACTWNMITTLNLWLQVV